MSGKAEYLSPKAVASLGRLGLVARGVVEGVITGVHSSPFHGYSAEFDEHRKYTAGDALRDLDWAVYARTDRYYIRRYKEETNLFCRILLDASASMNFAYDPEGLTKFGYGCCLAASVAWLCLKQRDSVGLTLLSGEKAQELAPSGKPAQMRRILDVLEHAKAGGGISLTDAFEETARRVRRAGMVVAISDMLEEEAPLLKALGHLRGRRHEVLLFHVLDVAEETLPYKHVSEFADLETGAKLLADPGALRRDYCAEIAAFRKRIKRACSERHIDYAAITTAEPFEDQLRRFLVRRKKYKK